MIRTIKNLKTLALTFGLIFVAGGMLAACEKGPAEEAGAKVDEVMSDAGETMGDAADDAGEAMSDAASDAKEVVKKAAGETAEALETTTE